MIRVGLLIVAALLAGCAQMDVTSNAQNRVEESFKKALDGHAARRLNNPAVVVHEGPRLVGAPAAVPRPQDTWPAILNAEFPYFSPAQTLDEIINDISARTGLNLVVRDRAPVGPGAATRLADPAANAGLDLSGIRKIQHFGSLAQLLTRVANEGGGYWRYRDGQVQFYRNETRTWQLAVPRGRRASTDGLAADAYLGVIRALEVVLGGGAGVAASRSGGSLGSVSASNNINAANQVTAGLGVNTPQGSAVISREFGILTVTSTPALLERVHDLVQLLNDRFSRNVHVKVRVMSWNLNTAASAGVSAEAALNGVRSRIGLVGGGLPAPASAQFAPSTITLSRDGNTTLSALIQAMTEYGTVSQITSGDVRAINGQPAPIQVTNSIGYIASSSTTAIPNVGLQTTVTPGQVQVGFNGTFTPLLLGDGRVALDYNVTLSSATITRLSTSGGGDSASVISTPNISSQSFQQSTVVRDGESIVLMGFERQAIDNSTATGVTSVGRAASERRELLVMVMEVSSAN
jgi:type IVB pilus formation R64 PilN family outer membrane protein